MLTWLTRRTERRANAHNLYGSIVALSRAPALYDKLQVPDTVEGRFEILVLHMFAFLEQINGEAAPLAQDIVDLFFADMDVTTRELGVGDMAVPKKMRGLAGVFNERMTAYKAAVEDSGVKVLSKELRQNIFGGESAGPGGAKGLVRYIRQLRQTLEKMSLEDLVAGRIGAPGINGKKR